MSTLSLFPVQDESEGFGQLVYDWGRFTKKLLGYYQGRGETGQAPYNAAIMFKMLFLCLSMECLGENDRDSG